MLPTANHALPPPRTPHRLSRLVIVVASLAAFFVLVITRSAVGDGITSTTAAAISLLPSTFRSPSVDLAALLQQWPDDGDGGYDYSVEQGQGWRRLGWPAQEVTINATRVVDARTGTQHEWNVPAAYNLAVLRLPAGATWDVLGVARGPSHVVRNFRINNQNWQERSLVAVGFRITSNGGLEPVTDGYMLDLPGQPKDACAFSGIWAGTFGPEDARLFWTDAGTPGMTFGRVSLSPRTCRSVAFVADLRNVFPELIDVLATTDLPLYHPLPSPASPQLEMVRRNDSLVEKNWQAFYPGATPSGQLVPHIHYSIDPVLPLKPAFETSVQIVYDDMPLDSTTDQQCIARLQNPDAHWHLHEATPLHRLTLCNRGCVPHAGNTVFMSLSHAVIYPRYIRFLVLHNITAPYNAISIGPRFTFNNRTDDTPHYTLAMIPVRESDMNADEPQDERAYDYPGHFFLDDQALVSFGTVDERMSVIRIPIADLLRGHKLCKDAAPEPSQSQVEHDQLGKKPVIGA
ncbi:hypothetical protein Q5752_006408 [Cryptotrichosporon argae]